MRRLILVFLGLFLFAPITSQASVPDELWEKVRSGDVFVLIRHALAPGTGDPSNFEIGKCSTQRNLNGEGRTQARIMGKIFKENGFGNVDTAHEMALGKVIELPKINSFFQNFSLRDPQTQMTRDWLLERAGKTPSVLVTHQVNITALTDIFPGSGELIFARFTHDGQIEVAGRLQTR